MDNSLRVWVGHDTSEERAYTVCAKSIIRRASVPVQIYPLRQDWLRAIGIYWRERDPFASTEFAFSRFLTPVLAGYQGCAIFVDVDFLFLADIAELFALYDPKYAIQCVQHNYTPKETTKMDGAVQTQNYRKNWTSLSIYNAGHHHVRSGLTPYHVNIESGKWLHQLEWTTDECIGALPKEWNYIVNHTEGVQPKALHFSEGLPLHGVTSEYSDLWEEESRA